MVKQYPLDPGSHPFAVRVDIQMRFSDIDGFGHANNGAIQSYFDLGRSAYLNRLMGPDFFRGDAALVVVNYTTDFLQQVLMGDHLQVRCSAYRAGRRSLSLLMALVRDGSTVCSVEDTVMSTFDKARQASFDLPDDWRDRIDLIEGRHLPRPDRQP